MSNKRPLSGQEPKEEEKEHGGGGSACAKDGKRVCVETKPEESKGGSEEGNCTEHVLASLPGEQEMVIQVAEFCEKAKTMFTGVKDLLGTPQHALRSHTRARILLARPSTPESEKSILSEGLNLFTGELLGNFIEHLQRIVESKSVETRWRLTKQLVEEYTLIEKAFSGFFEILERTFGTEGGVEVKTAFVEAATDKQE
jgi:hypothetical protein